MGEKIPKEVSTKEEVNLAYIKDPRDVEMMIYRGQLSEDKEYLEILCQIGDPKLLKIYLEKYFKEYLFLPEDLEDWIRASFFKRYRQTPASGYGSRCSV